MRYAFLLVILWACSPNPAAVQKLFITESGAKYHKEACHYLGQSSYTINISEAQTSGLVPCKVCWPATDVIQDPIQNGTHLVGGETLDKDSLSSEKRQLLTQCSAIARTTGDRCRRTTKNTSGKCWQHEQ
jgi:hypothetical protein